MNVFACCLYYVLKVQGTGTHVCKHIADMDATYGFFWHIIIIKDAAPSSLRSLKHKLLTSLEGPWSCPTLLLVGALP